MANDILFSLFMFTADVKPTDEAYRSVLYGHMRELKGIGYDGFDIPIAAQQTTHHAAEIESYKVFRGGLEEAGLGELRFTTNVGATRSFDPTSPYKQQREQALSYLKSALDITAILGGETVLAGPIIFPYGVFPTLDDGTALWSDALQDWLAERYPLARHVIEELAEYAGRQGCEAGDRAVDHWGNTCAEYGLRRVGLSG